MRALIWIIILVLIVWGIWYWVKRTPSTSVTNQPAAALQGLDQYGNGSSSPNVPSTGASTSSPGFESKG